MAEILVVDDREEDRYLLQTVLQSAGHRVHTAGNGEEALSLARQSRPDLVTSDILMPRMDGFALCRAWREDQTLRDTPFVFYSATYTREEDERFALALGADRFIVKPREPEALLEEIEQVLSRGRGAPEPRAPMDPSHFAAAHQDVVFRKLEDKLAELELSNRALGEAESRFRALVEQSLAGIFTLDQADRLSYVNPCFAAIFGHPEESLPGRSLLDLVSPGDRDALRGALAQARGGTAARFGFGGLAADGSRREIAAQATPAVLSGAPVLIGLLQDVTEKHRAEQALAESLGRLERSMLGTLRAVANTAELRDPYTAGHQRRVGDLAAAIAGEMGLPAETMSGVRLIGLVHDVGKIAVPAEILNKPGTLTGLEFDLIKTHSDKGYQVLRELEFAWPVADAILQHHERLDGSGYPRGLKGRDIILEARIVAVADVVEAMSSHRPYRPGLGVDMALAHVEQGAGRAFDADVVGACLRLFRERGYLLPK